MVAERLVAGRKLGCMVDVLCRTQSTRSSLVEQADTGEHDVTELLTTKNHKSEPNAAGVHDSSAVEEAQVPYARKRLAQWATRIWRDPEIHVGDSKKGHRENRPWCWWLYSFSCCGARVVRSLFRQCLPSRRADIMNPQVDDRRPRLMSAPHRCHRERVRKICPSL